MIYLDATALSRLVNADPHTPALMDYLRAESPVQWFTCAVTRIELLRIATQIHPDAEIRARTVLASCDLVAVTDRLLDAAAALRPMPSSTVNALHIAAAASAGPRLQSLVTYDRVLAADAARHRIVTIDPGGASC